MAEIENQTVQVKATGSIPSGANNYTLPDNKGWRGIVLAVDITANTGTTPTLTLKLQERLPGLSTSTSGWVDVTGATTTALDATQNGVTKLYVYPGATASANVAVNRALGEHLRVVATVGGTSSPTVTCAISAEMLV